MEMLTLPNDQSSVAKLCGILPVIKPAGITSKDVSRRLAPVLPRKIKIGHVGTLDPIATGVLPIVLGPATRVQDLLLDLPKTYEFDVTFGYETTTLDIEGEVVARDEGFCGVSAAQINEVLPQFMGEIDQVPPLYSAVKYKGKPLYKYARENSDEIPDLNLLKRRVTIFDLELISLDGKVAKFRATSSRGTYVRTLGKNISEALGTKGTITKLARVRSAGIDIEHGTTLEDLTSSRVAIADALIPLETLSSSLPYLKSLASAWTKRLTQGQGLSLNQELFDKALEGQHSKSILDRDLLLLSDHGKVFGLGKATVAGPNEYFINMKRGLR